MAALRIVIADDHQMWLSGMRQELTGHFEIVAAAETAKTAIAAIHSTKPDLAAIDLHMPDGGGLAVVDACVGLCPIVILTVVENERDVLDAVAAGAQGYVLKNNTIDQIVESLTRAVAGEPVFSPTLAALVIGEFRRLSKDSGANPLSKREREVLGLVSRGLSCPQIAAELFISAKTVDNHIRNTLDKLHLNRKDQLVRYALDHGIT